MALSWGDALLAGAAGVADYSNEKQRQRQARLDKQQDLMNRMRLEQAKSAYSVKLNEYRDKKARYNSIKTVGANTFAGQQLLLQQAGFSEKEARLQAQNRIQQGTLLTLDEVGDAPEFVMPTFGKAQQATSPIADWIKGYNDDVDNFKVPEEATANVDTGSGFQLPQEPEAPAAPQGLQAPQTTQLSAEAENIQRLTATPVKWRTDFRTEDVDGKRVVIAQQSNDAGDTRVDVVRELGGEYDEQIHKFKNGEMTDIYVKNRNTGNLEKIQSIETASLSASDSTEPKGVTVSTSEVDRFVNPDKDFSGFNSTYSYIEPALGAGLFNLAEIDIESPEALKRELSTLHLTYMKNLKRPAREAITHAAQDARNAQGYALSNSLSGRDIAKIVGDEHGAMDVRIFKAVDVDTLEEVVRNLTKIDRRHPFLKELNTYLDDAEAKRLREEENRAPLSAFTDVEPSAL